MSASLSSEEAARRLGVTRQTLYAYVSRGLIAALPGTDQRERRYSAEAIEQFAASRHRGRRPQEIARTTLDWGLPVLESGITLIEDGRLYYRGEDALALARAGTLETVAPLLWHLPGAEAFAPTPPPAAPAFLDLVGRHPGPAFRAGLLARFALAVEEDDTAWQQDRARLAAGSGALVRLLLAAMLGRPPSAAALHRQCAEAWRLDEAGADLVRMALVLCADHELNASGFTARCIASTGAGLHAAIIGGLAALSGPRHGGMTVRVEAQWRGFEGAADPMPALRGLLAGGGDIAGFGHPLYPAGDIRAAAILDGVRHRLPGLDALVAAVFDLTGRRPSLDFALVALRRALGLPEGAAFGLFALGRSVGWIAQALEQRESGGLIRPRATYTGPRP